MKSTKRPYNSSHWIVALGPQIGPVETAALINSPDKVAILGENYKNLGDLSRLLAVAILLSLVVHYHSTSGPGSLTITLLSNALDHSII